jgi:hypothetical protein
MQLQRATCTFVVLLVCVASAAFTGDTLPGGSGSAAAGAPCSAKLLAARGRLRTKLARRSGISGGSPAAAKHARSLHKALEL